MQNLSNNNITSTVTVTNNSWNDWNGRKNYYEVMEELNGKVREIVERIVKELELNVLK